MKAMIFAAGRGERMRPLTDNYPKVLLPLAGKPLIVHSILACKAAGIDEIVINLSYQGEKIRQALGEGREWGVRLQYSEEGEPALETAGGIIQALPLLGDQPFLALSGDIYTHYPLQDLIRRADQLDLAHLILVPNPDFKTQGDFGLDPKGILSSRSGSPLTYGNMGIFHPCLFEGIPVQRLGLGKVIRDQLDSGRISGECYEGPWFNLGTPEQLLHAERVLKEDA
jgi:MurNAc alpha-1-phosphate uridylyltransferase